MSRLETLSRAGNDYELFRINQIQYATDRNMSPHKAATPHCRVQCANGMLGSSADPERRPVLPNNYIQKLGLARRVGCGKSILYTPASLSSLSEVVMDDTNQDIAAVANSPWPSS